MKKKTTKMPHGARPVICPPDAIGESLPLRIGGRICRIAVIFCAVFGVALFLTGAIGVQATSGALFGYSFFCTVILSLLFGGGWLSALGGASGLLFVLILSLTNGNPIRYLSAGAVFGFNALMDRLSSVGYLTFVSYKIPYSYGSYTQEQVGGAFVLGIALLYSLLLVPFLLKKIRIAVPAVAIGGTVIAIFVYNISRSNWGVTLIIASGVAIFVMLAFDCCYIQKPGKEKGDPSISLFEDLPTPPPSVAVETAKPVKAKKESKKKAEPLTVEEEIDRYFNPGKKTKSKREKQKEKTAAPVQDAAKDPAQIESERAYRRYYNKAVRSRRSVNSICGFSALVLSLAILLIPTLTVTESFHTMSTIDTTMNNIREYVTAYLKGDSPLLDELEYRFNTENFLPRSTTAEQLQFTGVPLFEINVQNNSSFYLRTWSGIGYDGGSWLAVDENTLQEYRSLFPTSVSPQDSIRKQFYNIYGEDTTGNDWINVYENHPASGYLEELVNIRRVNSIGNNVAMPSFYDPALGVLTYHTLEPMAGKDALTFVNYYDGIFAGTKFDENDLQYSFLANIPIQTAGGWIDTVATDIADYNAIRRYFLGDDIALNQTTISNHPYLYAYAYQMTAAEQQAARAAAKMEDAYRQYVYAHYTEKSASPIIAQEAQNALRWVSTTKTDENGDITLGKKIDTDAAATQDSIQAYTYTERHDLVMALIDYCIENCTYTITPNTAAADPALDGVENFLTRTKEGYCVQFASAVCLMLREFDIPCRYVEGYMVTNLNYTGTGNAVSRYSGYVHDYESHAWVEVWYDGVGWIPYESTPAYYADIFGSSGSGGTFTPPGVQTDPSTIPVATEPQTTPATEPPIEPIEPTFWQQYETFFRVLLVALAVIAFLLLLRLLLAFFARRAQQKRDRQITLALQAKDDPSLSPETLRAYGFALSDHLSSLLSILDLSPKPGEFREEYAKRLSFALEDIYGYPAEYFDEENGNGSPTDRCSLYRIGEILESIAGNEFGHAMTPNQLHTLAEFLSILRDRVPSRLKSSQRLLWHLLKRKI